MICRHIVHQVRWSLEGTAGIVENLGSLAQVLEMRCGVRRFPDIAESGLLGPHIVQTSVDLVDLITSPCVKRTARSNQLRIRDCKDLAAWWIRTVRNSNPCSRNIAEVHTHDLRAVPDLEGRRIVWLYWRNLDLHSIVLYRSI